MMALFLIPARAETAGESGLSFERHVRPILKEYCLDCHGAGRELKGGLDLRLRRTLVEGGESGRGLVPGHPGESLIVQLLEEGEMPPSEKKVSVEKIDMIKRWIAEGALAEGEEPAALAPGEVYITPEERAYWAFQPVKRPEIPTRGGGEARWRTPIDALVAKAGGDDFEFAPDADRLTLIRRVALGLTGLPPTEAEVASFLEDPSADAYARMVDRYLESPHYGERLGRHWLDVAGYADSEGATNADRPRSWAWPYRDYVIRSLNADKPFDEFIVEQLAGDELVDRPHKNLRPDEIEKLTATGFLRMAADGTGSGDDSEASRNKTLGDTLKMVSSAFLGLTLECAQCHDHRYDPIPQRDYFQLRAIFEPALNPKQWRRPAQRLVSLYTDEDHERAAEVEAEAKVILEKRSKLEEQYIEEALRKEVENFAPDLREPLFAARMTAPRERTERQKELLSQYPSANITGGNLYQYNQKAADELKRLDAAAAKVREEKPYHAYLRALTEPVNAETESRLYHRGDFRQPVGEPLEPAALTITAPPGRRTIFPSNAGQAEGTTGRRTAFAKWLTSGRHPLVARVLVNRVWMHHFGAGLVGTPGDFGVLGKRPQNQPLLDYLADEFVAGGWSLKRLHRRILLSSVYRQGSVASGGSSAAHAYARWPVQRLDAETIRDRTLAVSGLLDREMHGPPIPVVENDAGQFSLGLPRRSLYAQNRRTQPVSLLQSFDAPVMETNCVQRTNSNSATQALMVMNGDFHSAQAETFAERVWGDDEGDGKGSGRMTDRIRLAFALAYGRTATGDEVRRSLDFLERQVAFLDTAAAGKEMGSEQKLKAAMTRLCHALISSNEFLYVD